MEFWNGRGILRHESFVQSVETRVFTDERFDLQIESVDSIGFGAILLLQRDDITIEIAGVSKPIPIFLHRSSESSSGHSALVFVPKRSPVWQGSSKSLVKGRASLLNFEGFDVGLYAREAIHLSACGWKLTMVPAGSDPSFMPGASSRQRHKVTHQLEFTKEDTSTFTSTDMKRFLEYLTQFFSFCHGGWLTIGFAAGLEADGSTGCEQWGIGRIANASKPDSFVDRHHLECMVDLYPLFMNKITNNDWADAVNHIVYWLQRSDLSSAGTDGGIILTQTALERFAWHLLVREKGALSENGFKKLTAADQIRLMLTTLEIPKSVPDGLEQLKKFSKVRGLDGPDTFTFIRNQIVHPPKMSGETEHLPFYDAYRLGRWYSELAVLASCAYCGAYSNRTRKDAWVGEIEQVPWAQPLPLP